MNIDVTVFEVLVLAHLGVTLWLSWIVIKQQEAISNIYAAIAAMIEEE